MKGNILKVTASSLTLLTRAEPGKKIPTLYDEECQLNGDTFI